MVNNIKKGQVWVETVIYTLIAFVMIAAVLAFVVPKIEEVQDKTIIIQTLEIMGEIDSLILSVSQGGAGNKRIIEIEIKKGNLEIDGINDRIVFEIESRYAYSEYGEEVDIGDIVAYTERKGKLNRVILTNNHSDNYNITYQNQDAIKSISKASTPYKISISNEGKNKFNDSNVCSVSSDCSIISGFVESCETYPGGDYCTYTAEKSTINFEIN